MTTSLIRSTHHVIAMNPAERQPTPHEERQNGSVDSTARYPRKVHLIMAVQRRGWTSSSSNTQKWSELWSFLCHWSKSRVRTHTSWIIKFISFFFSYLAARRSPRRYKNEHQMLWNSHRRTKISRRSWKHWQIDWRLQRNARGSWWRMEICKIH